MDENKTQNQNRQQKIESFLLDPEKTIFESITDFEAAISYLVEILSKVDIENLEQLQGKDGVTPVRGQDYFTEEDIKIFEQFILSKIPKVGVDLPSRIQVETFIQAEVAKIPRIKGDQGPAGKSGKDGKDGSPDTGEDIIKKIRAVGKNQRLKISDIRGLENVLRGLVDTAEEFDELKKAFENRLVAFGGGSGGGEGNDENAIHTDGVSEFDDVTAEASPAAGDYFIAERASDGTKIKVAFSDIGNGADGRTVLNGTVDPTTEGVDGDFYINTSSNEIFGPKVSGSWGTGTSLIGPAGADGADGSNGSDGADGKTVLNGSGAPGGGTGVDGDFYIDTAADTIYGPKTGGAWGSPTSLVGPQGPQGVAGGTMSWQGAWTTATGYSVDDSVEHNGSSYICIADHTSGSTTEPGIGASWETNWDLVAAKGDTGDTGAAGANGSDGADGRTVLNGTVDPTTEGVDGDFYIRTDTNEIFGPKASGTWPAGVSLVGPTGATGADGADADISELSGVVIHGATAGTSRPSGYANITWIGSVEPTNATNNDIWIDTA